MTSRLDSEQRIALTGLVMTFVVTAAWWALALWPVTDSPAWLERTRYVCFGVNDSGLPDAGGWIGLIAGPLGMLGIVLVGWGSAVKSIARRARRSIPIATVFSVMTVGTIAMIGGAVLRVRAAQAQSSLEPVAGALPTANYPRLDKPAPPLELIAHDEKPLQLATLRGRTVLVTFAYAHCTTICPVIVHDVLTAQKQLLARGTKVVVLVVTLDPWRDTPSRLASMAHDWSFPATDAWMLGGPVEDVQRVLEVWQVPIRRDERNGDVTHPALVYVIDPAGRIAFAATGGADALTELAQRVGHE